MFDTALFLPEGVTIPDSILGPLINTAILVAVVIILRTLSARFIRRSVASSELRGRLLVNFRNGFLLLTLLGLVMIWGDQLRTLALSIVAIAVAFVVATKELILCVTGSMLKSGAGSFELGDRIQVKEFRGDVIDQSLLATTILEVGPGKVSHQRTGRMIVIPNALFVSEPVVNESFTDRYDFHVFIVPFKLEDDWQKAREALLSSAIRHCESYLEPARVYMTRIGNQRGLEVPSVDPRVSIQVPSAGEIHLIVRIPVQSGHKNHMEQTILTDVFTHNEFARVKTIAPPSGGEPA
ncbi:MAG: mechanosensitive ion channel [Oleiphilaceae bacterium]|nr:mechanosensitive ion channel [Oleiphilaceae bacterium]